MEIMTVMVVQVYGSPIFTLSTHECVRIHIWDIILGILHSFVLCILSWCHPSLPSTLSVLKSSTLPFETFVRIKKPWISSSGMSIFWRSMSWRIQCITLQEWASLVVQQLRICLPMQGTQVWSLVLEDSICLSTTKPVFNNYVPQLLKHWSPCTAESLLYRDTEHFRGQEWMELRKTMWALRGPSTELLPNLCSREHHLCWQLGNVSSPKDYCAPPGVSFCITRAKKQSRCSLPTITLVSPTEIHQCVSGMLITWSECCPSIPRDTASLNWITSWVQCPLCWSTTLVSPAGARALGTWRGRGEVTQKDPAVVLWWNQLSETPTHPLDIQNWHILHGRFR